jgi:hypothetical protein
LAIVNKYLENNRQKVYDYQKVYKKAWYQKKKEELVNLYFPNLEKKSLVFILQKF